MSQKIRSRASGVGLVLLSTLMFGSYGVWSRLIGDAMGSFYQGWTRALIILLLLVPVALLREEVVRVKREDRKWLAIFLLCTSFTQAPVFYAFNHMDIGSATLLFFVSMFLTMNVIGLGWLGERLDRTKMISAILALSGMYLVFSFSLESFTFLAAIMAVVNGIASGGEVAFSKKLSGTYSPLYLILLSWFIILITNSLFSVGLGETQILPSLHVSWFWQGCYSIASLFGFWFVIAGFKHLEAGIGALLGLLEILFSIGFGILIFGESITGTVLVGAVLIVVAAALPHVKEMVTRPS